MRRLALALVWALALVPAAAPAAAAADYRMQWPLQLTRAEAAAHRVTLDAQVYRAVRRVDLGDLDVIGSDGTPVPAALFAPERVAQAAPKWAPLPWFLLPSPDGAGARDWVLIGRAGPDGALQHIEARGGATGSGQTSRTALLVDARALTSPVTALELQWQPGGALDLGYRVEGSNDLEAWQLLRAQGRLIDLQRDTTRLLQRRITLQSPSTWRYLRLTPERIDRVPSITAVHAVLQAPQVAPTLQWQALTGRPAPRGEGGGSQFDYELDGRYPVQWADVLMGGNAAVRWHLQSRESDRAPWRTRATPWVAFQLDNAGERSRSQPRALDGIARDRHWRLTADREVAQAPTLRLGYSPEAVVFLAQGPGPYTLVAGSARARRADAPLPQMIQVLRDQHGPGWAPSPATLGAPALLAGDAALQPQRDWKAWLLWGVLIAGALVVAALAASVLRAAPRER